MKLRRLHLSRDSDWLDELELIGADPETWDRLSRKCRVSTVETDTISPVAANILKQCMLSGGADAIVSRRTVSCRTDGTKCLIAGTPKQILRGCDSLEGQPFGLSELAEELRTAMEAPPELPLKIPAGDRELDFSSGPLIMGILNVTNDSFSDGGRYLERDDAVEHAAGMFEAGASIIDIGAESTRPGSLPVDPERQLDRILPVIEDITGRLDAVISVDTTSALVAEAAVRSGVRMINDVSALSDPGMAALAAANGIPLVLMHMQGTPRTMQENPSYEDVVGEVYDFLEERVDRAVDAGVPRSSVIVDPGIGFGKRLRDNLKLIRRIREFRWMGCRVMLGHSRKSFLGELTGLDDPGRREAGTHAVTAVSSAGADIFRVHDVEGTRQVLQVAKRLGAEEC